MVKEVCSGFGSEELLMVKRIHFGILIILDLLSKNQDKKL
jgi:hypothetical protein